MTDTHDPGGKRLIPLSSGVTGDAIFLGEHQEYRVSLYRRWAPGPLGMFVMMNPSTARPDMDDPSTAKIGRMARRWGWNGYWLGNTYAYRCTDQSRLLEVDNPIGAGNDTFLKAMARLSTMVVFAYGTPKHKQLRPRGLEVARMLAPLCPPPFYLRLSKDGIPWHPLYLPDDTDPQPWDELV